MFPHPDRCRLAAAVLLLPALARAAPPQAVLHEAQELFASDANPGDALGSSLAFDGARLAVGAVGDDDRGTASGSVYVFERGGGTWAQTAKLLAFDGAVQDRFGSALSLDGDRLAVSAVGDDDAGESSGSVYVYTHGAGGWVLEAKLVASDGHVDAQFGVTVALSGGRLAVGSPRESSRGSDSGAVYVFELGAGGWSETAKLQPADLFSYDAFGFALDLDGERLIAGSWHDDDNGSTSGSAYVFQLSGGTWVEEAKLLAQDHDAYDTLGFSAALSGDVALAGAYGMDLGSDNSGGVVVYERGATGWSQVQVLAHAAPGLADLFGYAVSMDASWIVGSIPRDDSAATNAGALAFFERCGARWIERGRALASDAVASTRLGENKALAVAAGILAVGVPRDDDAAGDAGSVYLFELDALPYSTLCAGDGAGTPCPCGNDSAPDAGEGCRNATGSGARLVPLGSTSRAADDLAFHACQLPPRAWALLFAGTERVQGGAGSPFGDGLLCAGGSVTRLGLSRADDSGAAAWGPGLATGGGWSAGDTRVLQAWFRDPHAGPCGFAFNTSAAVEVTFAP